MDAEGNSRELHTDFALDAIDFEKKEDFKMEYSKVENQSSNIANCEYFTTNFLPVKGQIIKDYSQLDSFVIYMCVGGTAEISIEGNSEAIALGQTLLIPAEVAEVKITANSAELLEVYI